MKRVALGFWLFLGLLPHAQAAENKPRVLTTFLPSYCFAANVAGDRAEVVNLLPGNVSLHDYQLTPGDLAKIVSADVILINGLGMETFLDRAIQSAGPKTKAKLVTITDGLRAHLIRDDSEHHHREEAGHHHEIDPHVWLDPRLAAQCVTNILRALQQADPANAAVYAQNAARYIASLHALDADLEKELAAVKTTPFITYHNAFRYFVRRYGLNLVGVVEQVPEIAPSNRELSALHKTIRQKQARALFTEPAGSSRLAKQIAKDAGIRLEVLDPLEMGELKPDAYVQGMRRNAAALVKGLK
jgi:zinc transport system substrate-binding protein